MKAAWDADRHLIQSVESLSSVTAKEPLSNTILRIEGKTEKTADHPMLCADRTRLHVSQGTTAGETGTLLRET